MLKKICKRDGRIVDFDKTKITEAIFKAAQAVGGDDRETAALLTEEVVRLLTIKYPQEIFSVEDVQDIVEKVLIEAGHARTAKAYILYRAQRTNIREAKSDLMAAVAEILKETNRENANVSNSPSAKMLQIASAASKQYYLSRVVPEPFAQAHRQGRIHIHDLDFYGKTLTCIHIPLGKLLAGGFDNGHGYIRPPKRPASATALAAIILQSSQNDMHGGQSYAFFDRELAPYVEGASEEETYQAMEAFIYNLNSMHSRAGAQVPFSSVNLGTDVSEGGRRVTRNLLLAYEKGLGRGETPLFPNIIFRVKKGVNLEPQDPNYDLFRLALRVAGQRMNPTFSFMDSSFNRPFDDEVGYMGCRTRVISNRRGPEVSNGRGNLSFTSINLPRLAIEAKGQLGKFYRQLEETFELVAEQLLHRFHIQAHLRIKDMPFLMGQGLYLGSDKLGWDEPIEAAIVHGTLTIGFIGLAETLTALLGAHHGEKQEAQELGLEIVARMRAFTDRMSEETNLNFSLLATPAEGLSGRFVSIDRDNYGLLPGITDKEYYTNSFHLPVSFPVGAYEKISLEGPYHKYCNGGHISYVELASPPGPNWEAVETLVRAMGENDMGYGGINFPIDFCTACAHQGVINEDHCPVCGSSRIRRIRRITGYFSSTDRFNDAKLAELQDRVHHL